jgi:hypothetical protein
MADATSYSWVTAPVLSRHAFLEPAGDGSKVLMHIDLVLSGGVAKYGNRVGIFQASAALMTEFAPICERRSPGNRAADALRDTGA